MEDRRRRRLRPRTGRRSLPPTRSNWRLDISLSSPPAEAADALPDDDAFEPEEFVPDSQRFVVEQDGTRYWTAAPKDGGVCLIARNGDPNSAENWSVSAGPGVGPATVVTSMIDDAGHQTALVSDGYSANGPSDLHELATNVWIGNVDPDLREDAGEG
jgi:hypothetical protein